MNQTTPNKNTYLSGLFVAGFVCIASLMLVVFKLNPFESTMLALSLFFVTLFFSLVCMCTLVGFYVRKLSGLDEMVTKVLSVSFRQGILLSVCAVTCLMLLMFGLLTWWSSLLTVIIITLVEFYFTKSA